VGAVHQGLGREAEAEAVSASNGAGPSGGSSLWAGRFSKEPAPEALELGRSLDFDIELLPFDIAASQAHVGGLADAGLLTPDEADQLIAALAAVPDDLAAREEIDETIEDVHLLVERTLTDRLGDLGAKLHAGRSRNDLVATDLRLWSFGAVEAITEELHRLMALLVRRTREGDEWVMPGLTHNRPAQVVTLGYIWAAHGFALLRDLDRLGDWMLRSSVSPLGAGAIATSTLGLDPAKAAERLGFDAAFDNALDAVGDRDTVIELASALAICAMHLSRLASDLARWSEPQIGYARLDDAYATGSSMMPQKRNPDVLELTRGKAARILGHLTTLAALPAGLPLGYHRDFQEDKEPIFDTVFTMLQVLPALTGAVETASFDTEAMRCDAMDEDLYATDLAEALVLSGIPFREAHRRTGELLRRLADEGRGLRDLKDAEWSAFGVASGASMLDPDRSVRSRTMAGGPSPDSVRAQADAIEAQLPEH
jgi:argininosuccinate lyase